MNITNIIFFKTSSELHKWFEENYNKLQEMWIGFYKKKSNKTSITYDEALDNALCFGWIDGIRKSVDESSYAIRFTPRKSRSIWSEVNIKRVKKLSEMKFMQPSGMEAFEKRDHKKSKQYSYEQRTGSLDPDSVRHFKENKKAWNFFTSQAPSYQKTAIWWVIRAKRQETRSGRLKVLIEDSKNGERLAMLRRESKTKK